MVAATVSLVVLIATLVVFIVVGVRASRGRTNVEDYVLARNSQKAGTLGLSFLAAGMGAWILFAPPEVGSSVGLLGVAGYALGAAAPFVAFAALGPRVRRVVPAGHSLVEFVHLRFGRAFHLYVGAISILYMLVFVTAELTAAGAVTSILSGLDPRVTVVAVAVATLAYTAYGGLRASLRTDRFQGWLILALLVALIYAVVTGVPGEHASAPSVPVSTGVSVAVTLIIAVTAANLFHQGYWQRVWAARDSTALRRGVVIGVGTTIPVVALLGGLGVLAAARGLDLGTPPAPFFALLAALPQWIAVAALVLTMALVASSVDTLESGLASLVTAERPSTSLPQARAITVVLMVPAVGVALQGYSVLQLFLIADLLCAATIVPALSSLSARGTSQAALFGAVAGLGGALGGGVVAGDGPGAVLFPNALPTLAPFAGAIVASTVVTVLVALAQNRRTDLEAIGAKVPALSGKAA